MNFTKKHFDFSQTIIYPPKDPIQEDMSILPGDQYIFPSIDVMMYLHKRNIGRSEFKRFHLADFVRGVHRVRNGIMIRMNFPIKVFVETLHNEYEWDTRKIIQKDYFCIETMMNFLAEKTITIQEDGAPFTYYTNAGL